MSNCRTKYRLNIIADSKKIIKGNASSYQEGDTFIDIPFGVSKMIKDRAQALEVARRKATEVNNRYLANKFGPTVFINKEQERAIRLEIAPPSLLLDAYEVKNGQKEPNLLFQIPDVEYALKVVSALENSNVRQPNKNIQGFYNDLQKQGVPKEQIEIIKSLNPENKTKEELIIDLQSNYSFAVEINVTQNIKELGSLGGLKNSREFMYNDIIYRKNTSDYGESIFEKQINGSFIEIDENEYYEAYEQPNTKTTPTQYYSNLTVPGGTAYVESEIRTPNIIPSIKGHAQFATNEGIGWFRSDDKVIYTSVDEVIEIMKKSGALKVEC